MGIAIYNATAPTVPTGTTISEQADSAGSFYANNEGRKASYSACTAGVVATANGVLLSVQGSATKTIRITRIYSTGVLTTAAQVLIQVNRCTGAVSSASGTVAITPRLLDTGNAVATAAVNSYTTSTIGAGATLHRSNRALFGPATVLSTGAEFLFGVRNAQSLVLRGTGDFMQLAFSASAFTGALFDFEVEFTEE